jgi:hypothetical protein
MHDPRGIALAHQLLLEQSVEIGVVIHQQNAMAGA